MRVFAQICLAATVLLLANCGYQLGGSKPKNLSHIQSVSVGVFVNDSLEPQASGLVTNSLAEALQRDGAYKLKPKAEADARIEGRVASVSFEQLRSSYQDTYQSTEMGVNLLVDFKVIEAKTNKVLYQSSARGQASLFNMGNQQTSKTNALSYAARVVGENISDTLNNG